MRKLRSFSSVKKKLRLFLKKQVLRYHYPSASITITVEYPAFDLSGTTDILIIKHPRRPRRTLVRYDQKDKVWQLYRPKIEQILLATGKRQYALSRFRWEQLQTDKQRYLYKHEEEDPGGKIDLNFSYFQLENPFERIANVAI